MKDFNFSLILTLIIITIFSNGLFGQINFEQSTSINQDGTNPHSSAILDLKSTEKGMLIPRMTSTQRFAISATEGLMVYDTDKESFWYHNGTAWVEISTMAGFELDNGVVRNIGYNNSNVDFIFGDSELPQNGQNSSSNHFFFDKSIAAFRTGESQSSMNSVTDSLGRSSFGAGFNVLAKGSYSSAFGSDTKAVGDYSTAFGRGTQSILDGSFVIGRYNSIISTTYTPPAEFSLFAIGNGVSENFRSTAFAVLRDGLIFGQGSGIYYTSGPPLSELPTSPHPLEKKEQKSSTVDSLAIFQFLGKLGSSVNAPNIGSIASGIRIIDTSAPPGFTSLPPQASFSTGINSFAKARGSSSLGIETRSHGYSGTVVGIYNDTLAMVPQVSITPETPLFVVGNGDDESSRSNALVIRKDGLVEIGTSTVRDTFDTSKNEAILRMGANVTPNLDDVYNSGGSNFRWHKVFATNGTIQTSDRRAKKNVVEIEYGLNQILQLKPVRYNWNQDTDKSKKSIGLIAQDLKEVIPEVVHEPEDKDELLGVNYSELIPVLIKGMQEQQDLIKELQSQLTTQNQKIADLEKKTHKISADKL